MSLYQKCSHADLVMEEYDPKTLYTSLYSILCLLIVLACIIIFIIAIVYYLILKRSIVLEKNKKEKINNEAIERKEKSIRIIQHIFYGCGLVLSVACYFYLVMNYINEIEMLKIPTLIIFTVVLFISILFRVLKKEKVSNIICAVMLAILIIGAEYNARIDSKIYYFNDKFEKYVSMEPLYDIAGSVDRIKDVDNFINEVRENNKSSRKIKLTYDDREYISNDELDELLNEIDKELENNSGLYMREITYDQKGYIDVISVYTAYHPKGGIEKANAEIISYFGNQTGSQVKSLLNRLISNSKTYADSNEEEKIVEVVGIGEGIDGLDIFYEADSDDSIEIYQNALRELSNNIALKHTYWIETIPDENYNGLINKVIIYYSKDDADKANKN